VQLAHITPLCTDVLVESIKTQQDQLLAMHAHKVTIAQRHPFIQLYVLKDSIAPLEQASHLSVH
jgi:hypothetical protein